MADGFGVAVLGVVETGANAAAASSSTRDVLVIATAATVASHAYTIASRERGLRALEKACPLLVPLVEEGWIEHPVTEQVVDIYLNELLRDAADAHFSPDTLVLGCTHYPLLRDVIRRAVPPAVAVIDSAEVTARQAAEQLADMGLLANPGLKRETWGTQIGGNVSFFATDSVEKFKMLGARFLGMPIEHVELVDLGG
jgi:glutamate racemase